MVYVKEKVAELRNLLANEVNENRLYKIGSDLLNELRQAWPNQKADFKQADINWLKEARDKLYVVRSFIDLQSDFDYITTSDDANDTINELVVLAEQLEGLKVAKRIEKEVREIHEKLKQLPSASDRKLSSELNQAIATLNSQAPSCRKCGSKMVIREGHGEYFWGCPRFPECWGKRWLSKQEIERLPA